VNPPDFHRGYFVAWRTDDFLELLRKPNAFRLLALIAYRARWRDGYSADGVGPGECLLGADDVARVLKLSPRAYRTSKTVLEKGGFATFSGTGLGTVARIVNSRVFSTSVPENDRPNDRAATDQRQTDDRAATTKKKEEGKKEESSKLQRAKLEAAEGENGVDRYDETEAGIVARFKALLGPAAAANDGGKWRMRHREQRDKTLRVLQACERDQREGHRPAVSWAAYAEDIWKRFAP
jgi:hypothetical protein